MGEVETEVGVLHVENAGDPANPAVLLWPSLFCTGAIWHDQVATLAPRHHVVVVDPPGHGHSGVPPKRFTLEATARATLEVLDALGVPDVVLIGGAWGGMVGVQLAASAARRLRGLVIINSPLDRWRGMQRLEMHGLAAMLRLGPRPAERLVTTSMLSARTRAQRDDRRRALGRQIRALDRRSLLRAARSAMFDRPSLLPLLPELRLPVLAIAGAQDVLWPARRAEAEVALIPGARFEVIPGVAHLAAYEDPDTVNALLVDFLSTIDASAVTTTVAPDHRRPV